MNTIKKGDRVEAEAVSRFMDMGYSVSIPFSQSEIYDLVIEEDGEFQKIQCKHGNLHDGRIKVDLLRTTTNTTELKRKVYEEGDIDKVFVYCSELDRSFLIPHEEIAGQNKVWLRVEDCEQDQPSIRWAEEYEV